MFELQSKSSIELPSTPPNDEAGAAIDSRDETRTARPGCDNVYSHNEALGQKDGTSPSFASAADPNNSEIFSEYIDGQEARIKREMADGEMKAGQCLELCSSQGDKESRESPGQSHEVQITVLGQFSDAPYISLGQTLLDLKTWVGWLTGFGNRRVNMRTMIA